MGDGDDIVIRIMEALTDERILRLLRKALYPQDLFDKLDQMSARIDDMMTQLTIKDNKIDELEKRIEVLEECADRTEQYTRRSNLVFSGFAESIQGENTDDKIIALVNGEMKLAPPLQLTDIARSHRLGAPRAGARQRQIIVRFASDRVRDAVCRARANLKDYNRQHREAPIYINDDLTKRRAKLAYDCRKLKNEKKILDTWSFNGKILIKDLTSKIVEISGPAALHHY